MFKQNLHTHSTYCDGSDTPREMVEKAIELGFTSIGFSGHSNMIHNKDWVMTAEGQEKYLKEIDILKKEYADKIKIFKGIEYDIYSGTEIPELDYCIGSVHGIMLNNEYIEYDAAAADVEKIINEYFGGDGMKYVKKYYEAVAQISQFGNFDIIGHFDIVTKHTENKKFFDDECKKYFSYAIEAAESLAGKIKFFEVNTGAIARGYRTTPYPAIPILKELKRLGFCPIITSDCHDKNMLECSFDMAREMLTESGFCEKYILTENGFIPDVI